MWQRALATWLTFDDVSCMNITPHTLGFIFFFYKFSKALIFNLKQPCRIIKTGRYPVAPLIKSNLLFHQNDFSARPGKVLSD
jgi:hypothetical protein